MRTKAVIGNWKMNGSVAEITLLSTELKKSLIDFKGASVIIMPPTLYLPLVCELFQATNIAVGAQNSYPKDFGAFTGETSTLMLKEFNCRYVLVGHSERRQYFHEDENFVAQKFHHAKEHDMIPILCVGETLSQREKNQTKEVIKRQLLAVSKKNKDCFRHCLIAYEPVWAIGTGKTAPPEQAQEIHQFIRELIADINDNDAKYITLLYGGSINENNAQTLFSMPDIDGGLVGGASLNAKQFVEIVKCINSY